jgi:uncharacterized protein (DUF488 family)
MQIYTIGFTKTPASAFFTKLKAASIEQLIDVRLNNASQLSGFSKRDDLQYFLKAICGADYRHELLFAPTQILLDAYKRDGGPWDIYRKKFWQLLEDRQVENKIAPETFARRTVLLCSEHTAEHCHRSVVVDYLDAKWGNVEAIHL